MRSSPATRLSGPAAPSRLRQATTCTVTGLKNAVEYTFTVTATNAIGTSDKSAASNPVKPDQRPDPPSSVSGEFGDGSVKLQWNQPSGDFSAVTSYSVLMSPGNAAGVTQLDNLTGTSTTVDNLVNGTAYTFQVIAHNEHPEPSDPSPSSAPVIPAGVPFAAAAPTVQKRAADATQPSATVTWAAPNGNGDDNLVYTLSSSTGRTWNGITGTSQEVLMDASTTDVTFTVRATNKAGQGEASPASAPQRFFQKPGPVSNLDAQCQTGTDNTVRSPSVQRPATGPRPARSPTATARRGTSGTLPAAAVPSHGPSPTGPRSPSRSGRPAPCSGEQAPAGGLAESQPANTYGHAVRRPRSRQAETSTTSRSRWNANGSSNGRAITNVEIRHD